MEYSVQDLIRILLKKWWAILLAVCLIAGLSVITSKRSYEKALADYDRLTTQTISTGTETGSLVATYQYWYEPTDYFRFISPIEEQEDRIRAIEDNLSKEKYDFLGRLDARATAQQVKDQIDAEFTASLYDDAVILATQSAMAAFDYKEPPYIDEQEKLIEPDEPMDITKHLSFELRDPNILCLTVSGLEKQIAEELIKEFLKNWKTVGEKTHFITMDIREVASDFYADTARNTAISELAQTVMKKPDKAASLTKTVGTAATYGFVLACFAILLITFIKDSRLDERKQRELLNED